MIKTNDFLGCINSVLYRYQNADTEGCFYNIKHLLYCHHNLEKVVYESLIDKDISSRKICKIADGLEVLYDYSSNHDTQNGIAEMIISCYARAFILSSLKNKHFIAYKFNRFLDKTYYIKYNPQQKVTYYCSHLGNYLYNLYVSSYCYDDYFDIECERIYEMYYFKTDSGEVSKYQQRLGKLIQWYLSTHIKRLNDINPSLLSLKTTELVNSIEDYYNYLCNIDSIKLKKLANQLLAFLLEDHTEESLNNFSYSNLDYVFNDETRLIERHDYMEEAQEDYEYYQQNIMTDRDYIDEYGNYSGSYAQDVAGYSDDDIDTIFDGDPDAYWNID